MDHLSAEWRKSTYSGGNGGNCVEVSRIEWRKSTYSGGNGGDCVEAGAIGRVVAVRDSKNPDGPVLAVAPENWRAFTDQLKAAREMEY